MPRRLPLFPLNVVLFPGTPMPLHIFEPRYRTMLADCLEGDERFCLLYSATSELPPPGAVGSKSNVVCDALILDPASRSDTYPYIEVEEQDVQVEHEASVSRIGEEQLFYLQSRGLTEAEASSMIVSGFIEPLVKELPMEYAIEMNRLIQLQMEGSIG